MRRLLAVLALVLFTCACSSDKGFGPSKEVDAEDYGSEWPLTVDSALLNCSPEGVLLVQIDGHAFGLDERAFPEDVHPKFKRVWAQDPSRSAARKDLSPLIKDAQALCE